MTSNTAGRHRKPGMSRSVLALLSASVVAGTGIAYLLTNIGWL